MQNKERMTARHLLLGCLLTVVAFGLVAVPAVSAQSGRSDKALSSSERANLFQSASGPIIYVPTKATVVDSTTHELRKPTALELDEIMVTLKPLTQDPTAGRASVRQPDGSTSLRLDGGLDTVLLARARPDGTFETRCVSSFSEAIDFLGLRPVPADSPAAKKFLSDERN